MAGMFWRAMRLRCPYCGAKGITAKWGELRDRCPTCSAVFEREEGYWVGAMIVNLGATMLLFLGLFLGGLAAFWPDVPWTALMFVSAGAMALFPVWFYPRSKTLWMWVDERVHPTR